MNGIAHLCGHHGQCAALLGLASALKEPGALDGLSGSIRLMFVPSEDLVQVSCRDRLREEGTIRYFGGKPEFMRRGHFDGVDMVMNVHQGGGSTDMSDLACVMPCAWFNVNGGFTGCGHRIDYRIVDPRRLCVDSAKAQILVVDALLRDSAAAAKDVIAKFKPLYPSIADYLKAVDEVFLDREAVVYDKDGHGSVRYW